MSAEASTSATGAASQAPTKSGTRSAQLCITNTELIQLRQDWEISQFTSLVKLCKPGQCLRSSSFKHPISDDVSWQLCLYPGGKRDENKGFVSLFLKMYAPPAKDVCINAEYRLYFIGDEGDRTFTNVNVGEFYSRAGKRGFGWGLRNLPRTKVLSCLRSDNSLYIHCEVDLLPDLNRVPNIVVRVPPIGLKNETVPASFVEEQEDLLNDPTLSDFTVIVGGAELNVHKCILAAHSDVFRAMFSTPMEESSKNRITIDDFSLNAIRQMLQYIYSGQCLKISECAEELIGPADKYNLLDLKKMCENDLCDRVSKDNVLDLVAIADLYRSTKLKAVCINFIVAYKKEFMALQAFDVMKQENPILLNEIFERIISSGESGGGTQQADDSFSEMGNAGEGFFAPQPPSKRFKLGVGGRSSST